MLCIESRLRSCLRGNPLVPLQIQRLAQPALIRASYAREPASLTFNEFQLGEVGSSERHVSRAIPPAMR